MYSSYYIENGLLTNFFPTGKIIENVDNYYVVIIMCLGIIGTILWSWFNYKSLKNLMYDNDLILIAFVFFIVGLFETNPLITNVNYVISIQLIALLKGRIKAGR